MIIDDGESNDYKFKISDHNLITITMLYDKSTSTINEYINITFNRKSEDAIANFVKYIDENISEIDDVQLLNNIIGISQKKFLEVNIKKRVLDNKKPEPVWFTENIRKEIATRRRINKEVRKESDPIRQEQLKQQYLAQKRKTHLLVQTTIEEYEVNRTNEIIQEKNRKKLWDHINKLKRKDNCTEKKLITLYNSDGKKTLDQDIKRELESCWIPIYNQSENRIISKWIGTEQQQYYEQFEKDDNYIVGNTPAEIDLSDV